MIKKLICFLLLTASVICCSCKEQPDNTDATPTSPTDQTATAAPETTSSSPVDNNGMGKVEFSRDANAITVSCSEASGGKQLSVLILTDEKFKDNWQENTDAVINVGQISLDDKGEGRVTLDLGDKNGEFVVFLFSESGDFIKKAGADIEK